MEPTVNRSLQRRFEIERNQKFNQMQRNQKGQRIHQKCDRFALKCVSFFLPFTSGSPSAKPSPLKSHSTTHPLPHPPTPHPPPSPPCGAIPNRRRGIDFVSAVQFAFWGRSKMDVVVVVVCFFFKSSPI